MLVLASASPRRREALAAIGVDFRVVASRVPEARASGESPEAYASRIAREKAEAVAARLAASGEAPWVLGADTVVAFGDEVLGKPVDRDDARRMIASLAGRTHRVVTAWALVRSGESHREGISVADVAFRRLSDAEIDRYVETGEGDDKAGAYAVQGAGLWLVDRVTGPLGTVVGLPLVEVLAALRAAGVS